MADDVAPCRTECPHCAGQVAFPEEWHGHDVDCPHCHAPFVLPEADAPMAAAAAGVREDGEERSAAEPNAVLTLADLIRAFRGRVRRRVPRWSYQVALLSAGVAMVVLPVLYGLGVIGLGTAWVALAIRWFQGLQGPSVADTEYPFVLAVFRVAGLGLGAMLLFFLVKPLVVRPRPRRASLALRSASEPVLFALLQLVCDAVGAPVPDRVEVDCRLNASAGFQRGLGSLIRGKVVLRIGLPLVALLDLRGLAGVLAHELWHFNQRAGLRACTLIRAVNAWLGRIAHGRDAWDEALEGWAAGAEGWRARSVAGLARLGAAVSRAVFTVLWSVGQAASGLLLRQMELDADRVQIGVAGSATFERTLGQSRVLQEAAREVYRRLRGEWDRGGALPEDLPAVLARAVTEVPEAKRRRWIEAMEASGPDEAGLWDTHPREGVRLAQARALNAPGVVEIEAPASGVFARFDVLCRQATALHYEDVLGVGGDRSGRGGTGGGEGGTGPATDGRG